MGTDTHRWNGTLNPFSAISLPLLLGTAFSPTALAQTQAVSETVAQVRHDLFGQQMVPLWQYLSLSTRSETLWMDIYGGLEWSSGLDRMVDPDIYLFSLGGRALGGRWSLGRQRGIGALRPQTFDGLRYDRDLGSVFALQAWAGYARHQDLDDLLDGAGVGRIALLAEHGDLTARLGTQLEAGPDTPFIPRQDLEARLEFGGQRRSALSGRLVLAEPGLDSTAAGISAEWATLRFSGSLSPLELGVHVQHREAADPWSLFGDALLETLAGGRTDEAGISLRLVGRRWTSTCLEYALSSYGTSNSLGHRFNVSYSPGPSSGVLRLSPALSSAYGPGGQYHALSATLDWQPTDATSLRNRLAIVPYQRISNPWALAWSTSLDAACRFASPARAHILADLSSDSERVVDLRLAASLSLELP